MALVSTFAQSLGLSVAEEQVGFGLGVLLMVIGLGYVVWPRLPERVTRQLHFWSRPSDALQAASDDTSERRPSVQREPPTLKSLLRDGMRLQACSKILDTELFQWVRETWELLEQQEPLAARAFFGTWKPPSRGYFKPAYISEVRREGHRRYLDKRIEILIEAISRCERSLTAS